MIKFHRIDRLYTAHKEAILKIADEVYSEGQVLRGSAVSELEATVAQMCGRKYALAVGSCTDALTLALMNMELEYNDKVIVTPFTFDASITSIKRAGGMPVYHDILTEDFHMDLYSLDEVGDEFTKGVVGVNLFGQMMDMIWLERYCREQGLFLVEDAAQSFTSEYKGRPAGSFGDISCISFDPTKIFPAFSTGGMLLTDEYKYYENAKFWSYKNFGQNSQLSTFDAALILYWFKWKEKFEERRREIAMDYCRGLESVKEVELPKLNSGSKHIWHKFVIRCDRRNLLMSYLKGAGIETKIHYNVPGGEDVLSLPIYPHLLDSEQKTIIDFIKKFYQGGDDGLAKK